MARTYQTNVALEELRGKLAPNRELEYAENNNPAFEAPAGRQYARNYKSCIVLCKRASSGKTYFQVKTKTATLINAASKRQMALLGGAGAMIGTILTTSAMRSSAERAFALAKQSGATDAKTLRKYLTDILQVGLDDKKPIIAITASYDGESASLLLQNPWVYTNQAGGVPCPVRNAVLVKFWPELATNPVIFTVDGRKGVAHGGEADADNFDEVVASRYNVLGLSIDTEAVGSFHRVKLGDNFVVFNNGGTIYSAVGGRVVTKQAGDESNTTAYVLQNEGGDIWDD